MEQDFQRVVRVAEAAPEAEISLDANQGYSPKEALTLVDRLMAQKIPLVLLEQPVHKQDIAGMKFIRERCPVPVAADESVFTPTDALRIVEAQAADVINIKVAKAGILGALDIIGITRAANLKLMIGSMTESKIGLSASIHLVCGTGIFSYYDLDTVFLLKPFACPGGFDEKGPIFSVANIKTGTGIEYNP